MTDWNWALHGLLDAHTHNKPHPHSQGHREPFCETSYPTSSIRPILLISTVLTQWLFRSMLHIPPSTTKSSKEPYEAHGTIQP